MPIAMHHMVITDMLFAGWTTWWSFTEKVAASVRKASVPQSGVAHKVSWYARKVCYLL